MKYKRGIIRYQKWIRCTIIVNLDSDRKSKHMDTEGLENKNRPQLSKR